ncbi:MAG: type III pantothenate kinase [Lachnospiraceae bacterium]|nr:type III pantothenate kinase [Lachnospiraceae bacterium]
MILTVDIGNSNICFALHDNDPSPLFFERVSTDRRKSAMAYEKDILAILKLHGTAPGDVTGAVLSSVVESVTNPVTAAIEAALPCSVLRVSEYMKKSFDNRTDRPETVGTDILCDVEGALSMYGAPLMTFDLGTATVATFVQPQKNGRPALEHVFIHPGVRTSLYSLSENTAALPDISLEQVDHILGTDTVSSIRAGIFYGTAGLIDGFATRFEEETGSPVTVCLTGGLSPFIAPYCRHEVHRDGELLMRGLYRLWEKNH